MVSQPGKRVAHDRPSELFGSVVVRRGDRSLSTNRYACIKIEWVRCAELAPEPTTPQRHRWLDRTSSRSQRRDRHQPAPARKEPERWRRYQQRVGIVEDDRGRLTGSR